VAALARLANQCRRSGVDAAAAMAYGVVVILATAAGSAKPHETRRTARTAVRSELKYADESVVTVVPCRSAMMRRDFGSAHTMSLPMVGLVRSGTPATVRDAGCVGCGASSDFALVVVYLSVAIFNAVAGLATNVSIIVLCCSATDLASSKASRSTQSSPASTAVGVIDSRPDGPLDTVLPKNA
jgi:hypothetical protein